MKKTLKISLLILLSGCNLSTKDHVRIVQVNPETIGKHIEQLASDDFMGRMPATEGEIITVNYLEEEFKKIGLKPGNGDSYFQEVPMVEITGTPDDKMIITGPDKNLELAFFEDFVAFTTKPIPEVALQNSELVFAGYGIVAPEYGWNDYEGVDWKGKTAVVLVNDPGFRSGDSKLFKGDEMTYYGRWTYKYEEAGRQGAAGIIIIHETAPAAYGWNVVQSSNIGKLLQLESDDPSTDIQGWITGEAANKIFEASRLQNRNYKELARSKDFSPVPLGLSLSLHLQNKIKRDVSRNVVALLPGTDRKDEYIIYSGHWDHFGIGRPVDGDSIYNGAVDNATGIACILAIAEAFKKSGATGRSVVFMAVTAEEQGLLGSAYYAAHPIYEPDMTVANINLDAIFAPSPMKDLTIVGWGHSEMDEYARQAAAEQARYIIPDPEAEKGNFFRSDQYNFAKIGIPVLYARGSCEDFEHGTEYIQKIKADYLLHTYHQPSDEYDPETSGLSGIQFDAQLLFNVGLRLSNEDRFPEWYATSEFRVAREGQSN